MLACKFFEIPTQKLVRGCKSFEPVRGLINFSQLYTLKLNIIHSWSYNWASRIWLLNDHSTFSRVSSRAAITATAWKEKIWRKGLIISSGSICKCDRAMDINKLRFIIMNGCSFEGEERKGFPVNDSSLLIMQQNRPLPHSEVTCFFGRCAQKVLPEIGSM